MSIPVATEPVRCSAWARAEGVDPIGTAGCYDGYLLVDLPLPWPRDIGEVDELREVGALAASRKIRVQATVPQEPDAPRLVLYHRPPGEAFAGFRRAEAVAAPATLTDAAIGLLAGAEPPAAGSTGRDVLVCTHGRRDTCCGSLGTRLAVEVESASGDGDRASRTSHTGGHRFAPTFVVLPEATAWAFADADLVDRVLHRRGDAADVADRYRGCAGLASPAHQVVEREVLRVVGWSLLDRPRYGVDLPDGRTGLVVHSPDGAIEQWDAEVTVKRMAPVPDCGRPLADARKSEPEYEVRDLVRRDDGPAPH